MSIYRMLAGLEDARLKISDVRRATNEEWDQTWLACPYATYFHGREWAEIWQAYTRDAMRPKPTIVQFSDGKTALVPLTAQRIRKGLLTQYVSSPAGTFGGWLSKDPLSSDHAHLLAREILRVRNIVWRVNPFDPVALKAGINPTREDETYVLDLTGGFDQLFRTRSRGHGRLGAKARRAGVRLELASTEYQWRDYYATYQDSLRRWGDNATSRYEWPFFEFLYRRTSRNIQLFLAVLEQTVIAGVLCFYAPNHVVSWHSAVAEGHFDVRPVEYVYCEAIEDACRKGYARFDLNPSGGHTGVTAWKKGLGADPFRAPVIIRESVISQAIGSLAHFLQG